MRHPGQAIMIAWRAAHGSGGCAPRRQSLPLVAPCKVMSPSSRGRRGRVEARWSWGCVTLLEACGLRREDCCPAPRVATHEQVVGNEQTATLDAQGSG